MDLDWAAEQCELLIQRTNRTERALKTVRSSGRPVDRGSALAALNEQAEIVRNIARRVSPNTLGYFDSVSDIREWTQVAGKVLGAIKARRDYSEQLGPVGPALAADSMHPRVWRVASVYWDTGLYDDAIEAAAKLVRAQARDKAEKPDLGENAVGDLFSKDGPTKIMPRLRFPEADREDPKTWEAMHQGALHFTKGAFLALRNPRSHHILASEEQHALEELAAFSLIARWIDQCDLEPPTR